MLYNKYAGPCVECGQIVPAGYGELQSVEGQRTKWRIRHIGRCAPPVAVETDDGEDDDGEDDTDADAGPPPPFGEAAERAAWTHFAFAFARVAGAFADSPHENAKMAALEAALNLLDESSRAFLTRRPCAARLAAMLTSLARQDLKTVSAQVLMEAVF